MIQFKDCSYLTDGELDLRIRARDPGNIEYGLLPSYHYTIFLHNTNTKVGHIDIRIGYNENTYYMGSIGYEIKPRFRGNRYAQKACLIIKLVALAHDMKRLLITCDATNIPSRKTCENSGLKLIDVIDVQNNYKIGKKGPIKLCAYEWVLE